TIAICSMGIFRAQITEVTPPPVAAQSNSAVEDTTAPALATPPVASQEDLQNAANKRKKLSNVDLSHRGADHFMFQYVGLGLSSPTDEFSTQGFSRELNF